MQSQGPTLGCRPKSAIIIPHSFLCERQNCKKAEGLGANNKCQLEKTQGTQQQTILCVIYTHQHLAQNEPLRVPLSLFRFPFDKTPFAKCPPQLENKRHFPILSKNDPKRRSFLGPEEKTSNQFIVFLPDFKATTSSSLFLTTAFEDAKYYKLEILFNAFKAPQTQKLALTLENLKVMLQKETLRPRFAFISSLAYKMFMAPSLDPLWLKNTGYLIVNKKHYW